ncbi:MAG: WbqC family protein [Pseudonocardiaceae bacterium]
MANTDVLVAHQPAYLPWSGYFSRLLDVRELVVLDHVQFSERGWQHRNFVRGHRDPVRLTVPIRRRFGQPLHEVRLADAEPWAQRHWRTLVETYRRAPHWAAYADQLEAVYRRAWGHLVPLDLALTELLLRGFGLEVSLVCSSSHRPAGANTQMLVELCRRRGASTLRVGTGAIHYLDTGILQRNGIDVEVASYAHPPYGDPTPRWAPGLSALDLLLYEGPNARAVLERGARTAVWEPARKAVSA